MELRTQAADLRTQSEGDLNSTDNISFWNLPGFCLGTREFGLLRKYLLRPKFTDPGVLQSNIPQLEKDRIKVNNNLAVLLKGLLFHQDYLRSSQAQVFKSLASGFDFPVKSYSDLRRVCMIFLAARHAYLAYTVTIGSDTIQTIMTDLVDDWIRVRDSDTSSATTITKHDETKFSLVRRDWQAMIAGGRLLNAGQVVDDVQPKQEVGHLCRSAPSRAPDVSTRLETLVKQEQQESSVKQERDANDNSDGYDLSSSPISGASPHTVSANHKRKATATVKDNLAKRRRTSQDSDDESTETNPQPDSDADTDNAALTKVRELAEQRHTLYKNKLNKMKARYMAQKRNVRTLGQQLNELVNAQSTQISLSPTVKSNTQTLKRMVNGLEEQKKSISQLQSSTKVMEGRLKKANGISAVQVDELYGRLAARAKAQVKDEVGTTWKGAALELSTTKRDVAELKKLPEQVKSFSSQLSEHQACSSLHEKSILNHTQSIQLQGQSLTRHEKSILRHDQAIDRHEKSNLNQAEISVKQAARLSMMETEFKSKVERHEQRLVSVESQLVTPDRRRWKQEDTMPLHPRHNGPHGHGYASQLEELRALVKSQAHALAIQGKQLGELSKEIRGVKETTKAVPDMKTLSSDISKKLSDLDGMAKEVSNLEEMRKTMSNVLGRQAFGEQATTETSSPKDKRILDLSELSKETANYKELRTSLASVLDRQAFEDAMAARPPGSRPRTPPNPTFGNPALQKARQSTLELGKELEAMQGSIQDKDTADRMVKMMEKLEDLKQAFSSPSSGP